MGGCPSRTLGWRRDLVRREDVAAACNREGPVMLPPLPLPSTNLLGSPLKDFVVNIGDVSEHKVTRYRSQSDNEPRTSQTM